MSYYNIISMGELDIFKENSLLRFLKLNINIEIQSINILLTIYIFILNKFSFDLYYTWQKIKKAKKLIRIIRNKYKINKINISLKMFHVMLIKE